MSFIKHIGLSLLVASIAGCGGNADIVTDSFDATQLPEVSAVTLSAPEAEQESTPMTDDLVELLLKRAQWASQNIEEYRVTFRAEAALVDPTEIVLHVAHNQVIDAYKAETGESVNLATYDGLQSIEDMFATVEGLFNVEPHALYISYDETYGFPTEVYMDYRESWFDDQYTWSLSDFLLIRQGDASSTPGASGQSTFLTF